MKRVIATILFLGVIHWNGLHNAVLVVGDNVEATLAEVKAKFPTKRIFVIGSLNDGDVKVIHPQLIRRSKLSRELRRKWKRGREDCVLGAVFERVDQVFKVHDVIATYNLRNTVVVSDKGEFEMVENARSLKNKLKADMQEITLGGALSYTGLNLKK